MANGLGLGGGFSEEFRAKNAGALESVASGPSVAEVTASRPAGLGLSGASAGPGSTSVVGGLLKGGAYALEQIATLGTAEIHRANRAARAREQALIEQQMQAQIRHQNIINLSGGLEYVGELSRNVAAVQDPEQRAAIRTAHEAALAKDAPELVPLFAAMVENAHIAYKKQEEWVAAATKASPTFARTVALNDFNASKLTPEQISQIGKEWGRTEAREGLPAARGMASRLVKFAQQQDPQRFAEMKESGGSLSTDEAEALVSEFSDLDPDFNDPAKREVFLAALREFPEQLGFKPSADVAEIAKFEEKEQIKAKYKTPDTVVNVGGAKGGEEIIYEKVRDQVSAETGNPLRAERTAVAAVQGDAFTDPILGKWVIGDKKKAERATAAKPLFDAISELEKAGAQIVAKFRNTDVFTEGSNQIEKLYAAGDPDLERYEFWRTEVAGARTKLRSGAAATDQERKMYYDQLPSARALAKEGQLSPAAISKMEAMRKAGISEYAAFFEASDKESVETELQKMFPTALGGASSPSSRITVEEIP